MIVVLGKHESLDLRTSLRAKLDWADVLFFFDVRNCCFQSCWLL